MTIAAGRPTRRIVAYVTAAGTTAADAGPANAAMHALETTARISPITAPDAAAMTRPSAVVLALLTLDC